MPYSREPDKCNSLFKILQCKLGALQSTVKNKYKYEKCPVSCSKYKRQDKWLKCSQTIKYQ